MLLITIFFYRATRVVNVGLTICLKNDCYGALVAGGGFSQKRGFLCVVLVGVVGESASVVVVWLL